MKRSILFISSFGAASALVVIGGKNASACGGCFHPPTQTANDITDERMLLSVSGTQSTLYDQIRYSGSPASFAWVLPIHGTVDVGLSADVLFDAVDTLTATQITAPPSPCPSPACLFAAPSAGAASGSASMNGGDLAAVTVTKQENVGPYATVQLHTTDPSALNTWLATNQYVVPANVQSVIDQYVTEGFDFLAMKLLPNAGVQSMRPVRVTSPGASLSLPLRMAAIGTGNSVGITIWVVADGRYEPQNFPFYYIPDSQLVWDWSVNISNYSTLRVQNDAILHNAGWEIESSLNLNEQLITNVILSGGVYYGGQGGFGGISVPAVAAANDYLPVTTSVGGTDAGTTETAEQVRTDDIATLFAGLAGPSVRITRMRSDIVHTAMKTDFVLQASGDQSEISNVRTVTQSVNVTCPIYSGCSVVGTGTLAQARASVGITGSSGAPTPTEAGASSGASGSIVYPDASVPALDASVSANASAGSSGVATSGTASGTTPGVATSGSTASGSVAKTESGGGCSASAPRSGADLAGWSGLLATIGIALTRGARSRRGSKTPRS